MSKEIYVPADGIAHKVTKVYAPVNGVARSVKKVYKGVNGIARQVFEALPPVGTALNDLTWTQIRAISDAGMASRYFSVGDTKTITINGKVGATTFSNLVIDAYIIGIDHNSALEGTNRIHFKLGKIGGVQVALLDSIYLATSIDDGYFNMNPSYTSAGGWRDSYMRKTLLGNSSTPDAPLSNSMMAALPAELRAVMKSVTKYTDNVGKGTGNVKANISATVDYLFLLSEFELMGFNNYANEYEPNYQAEYEYFKPSAEMDMEVHMRHSLLTRAATVWTRSPAADKDNYYMSVTASGNWSIGGTDISHTSSGLAPGFCI